MLLVDGAAARSGPEKTAEQRRYDITSCNNLASHPQPELPPMTADQCLAMLGYDVKGPNGTPVAPPRPISPSNSQIELSAPRPVVPVAIQPTPVADTSPDVWQTVSNIRDAYNNNRRSLIDSIPDSNLISLDGMPQETRWMTFQWGMSYSLTCAPA